MLRSMNSDFSPTWAKQDRYTTMLKPISMALDSLPVHHSKSPNRSAGYLMGLSENTWYTPNLSTSHCFSSSKYMIHIDTHPKIINCSWYSHQNLSKSDDFSSKSIKQWWYSHGILMVYHHLSHPKKHLGGRSTTPWSPSCSRTNAPPDGRPQTIVALMNSNGF